MRRVFGFGLLAAVTTLLGVLFTGLVLPVQRADVVQGPMWPAATLRGRDFVAPHELLQTPLRLSFSRVSLNDALREVGDQLQVPMEVDAPALARLAPDVPARVELFAAERPAYEWLRRILRQADPDGRLRLTFAVGADDQPTFLITTRQAADDRFLFVVPDRFLTARPSTENPPTRQATFADALQYFAGRMGAVVRFDREALQACRLWPERLITLPTEFVSPEYGLYDVLRQADGRLTFRIDNDELGRRTVLVSFRSVLAPEGLTYRQLVRSRPFTRVWELPAKEPAWMTFGERLRRPIDDAPVDLPLREALQRVVKQAEIPIVVHTQNLLAADISPAQSVRYEPRGREVRAVLYDLLTQADGQKSQRLIYCYHQRSQGEMTLIVTTRDAAQREGRSIPFDFGLVSDDEASVEP